MSALLSASLLLIVIDSPALAESSAAQGSNAQVPVKIKLTTDMLINETGLGDAGLLVDEQDEAGSTPVNAEYTNWLVNNNQSYLYPAGAVIDLGRRYKITGVYLYDPAGSSGDFKVSYGPPFQWIELFTDPLKGDNVWNKHDADVETRFLQLSKVSSDVAMSEIVVYGYPLEDMPAASLKPAPTSFAIPVNEAIGTNAFIDSPIEQMKATGVIREYHNWSFVEEQEGQNKFSPSANNYWDFDEYYKQLKDAGIIASPAIQGNAPYVNGSWNGQPIKQGADPLDPQSYYMHASHLYQYAARYGSSPVPLDTIKVAPGQEKKTGLGYLSYYEDWNEPDASWQGDGSVYFSPYEFAAMVSADYDGHQSALGEAYGVKNADPNAKLVMGGLADPGSVGNVSANSYIRAMKFWSDYHRTDGVFPADVLNIHHYWDTGWAGSPQSPEEGHMKEWLEQFVQFRDRYLPGKELWLTEFGYDTSKGMDPLGYWGSRTSTQSEQMQADWIIRGFLASLSAGIDRTTQYMIRDANDDPNNNIQYSSSGFTSTRNTGEVPKISYYYMYAFKDALKGMVFDKAVQAIDPNVWIYTFKSLAGSKNAYVVWSPTRNGSKVNGYKLQLDGKPSRVTSIELTDKDTDGVAKELSVQNGAVKVNVSETPLIVLTDQKAAGLSDISGSGPIAIPAKGSAETPLSATVTDQNAAPLGTESVHWSVTDSSGRKANGLSIDKKGVLAVKSSAQAGSYTITASASAKPAIEKSTTITLYKASAAGIEISGIDAAAIPAKGSSTAAYAGKVTDQHQAAMAGEIDWKVLDAAGHAVHDVTVDKRGVLTVNNTAAPGSYTIQASLHSNASVKAAKTVTLAPAAKVDIVSAFADGALYSQITIPPSGKITITSPYAAKSNSQADGKGVSIGNDSYAYSVVKSDTGAPVDTMSVDKSGYLTVNSRTAPGMYKLTAVSKTNPAVSGTYELNLFKLAGASISSGPDTIAIPEHDYALVKYGESTQGVALGIPAYDNMFNGNSWNYLYKWEIFDAQGKPAQDLTFNAKPDPNNTLNVSSKAKPGVYTIRITSTIDSSITAKKTITLTGK